MVIVPLANITKSQIKRLNISKNSHRIAQIHPLRVSLLMLQPYQMWKGNFVP